MSVGLFHVTAVRSSAASISCPSPVALRWSSAASVDRAAIVAVEKSTYGTAARDGSPGGPDRYRLPDAAWARPSKPTLWLHSPPDAHTFTVVRMMSGFTARTLS